MFEFSFASSQKTPERFLKWFATYVDADADIVIDFKARHAPDDVKDLNEVSFLAYMRKSTSASMATSVVFRNEKYIIEIDNAPFTRSEATDAINYALSEIPRIFPSIMLPEGYPEESRRR